MIDLKKFMILLTILEDNYSKKLPEQIIAIWYDEFKTMTEKQIKNLFIESIKEFVYFPTINQVKSLKKIERRIF